MNPESVQATPEDRNSLVQREKEPETAATGSASTSEHARADEIDPYEIAERVYQLMRAELRIERERRGWGR